MTLLVSEAHDVGIFMASDSAETYKDKSTKPVTKTYRFGNYLFGSWGDTLIGDLDQQIHIDEFLTSVVSHFANSGLPFHELSELIALNIDKRFLKDYSYKERFPGLGIHMDGFDGDRPHLVNIVKDAGEEGFNPHQDFVDHEMDLTKNFYQLRNGLYRHMAYSYPLQKAIDKYIYSIITYTHANVFNLGDFVKDYYKRKTSTIFVTLFSYICLSELILFYFEQTATIGGNINIKHISDSFKYKVCNFKYVLRSRNTEKIFIADDDTMNELWGTMNSFGLELLNQIFGYSIYYMITDEKSHLHKKYSSNIYHYNVDACDIILDVTMKQFKIPKMYKREIARTIIGAEFELENIKDHIKFV